LAVIAFGAKSPREALALPGFAPGPKPSSAMLVSHEQLRFCAERTKAIVAKYLAECSEPENKIRSAEDLYWTVKSHCEKEILVKKLLIHADTNLVRALYINKGTHYEIYVISGLNDPAIRYYKAKELFQVVLHHEADRTPDLLLHLSNMILRSAPEGADLALGRATVSETLAEIAATEFLFPFADRVNIRKADGNINPAKAAADYGVPQWLVEYAISEDYMSVLAPFFGI
jgi:hypothetical protein